MAGSDKTLKTSIEADASQGLSELDRYNAKLKEMAERQEAAEKSARELADAEAYAALKLELKAKAAERAAAQAAEEKAYAAQAAKEVAGSASTYTKAMVEQIATDDKAFASKKQLKDMFKQLGREFPLLGQAGRLALNPIAFAVAGITAAFVIYRKRVEEASHAMARMELPDLSELNPAKISAAAEAYKQYADALNGVIEKYNAIPAAAQRAIAAINTQAEREKKLVEARKNLELAEAKTPEQRLAIMNRYASFGVETDAKTRQRVIDEQKKEKAKLEEDARKKAAQAGTIRIAPAETDADNEDDLKAQAEAAKKAIAEAKEMKNKIGDLSGWRDNMKWSDPFGGLGRQISATWSYFWAHGDKDPAQAMRDEDSQIATAQAAVDRHNNFRRNKANREALRDKRGRLITESGEETGQAAVLGQDIATAQSELNKDTATNREVARLNALAEMKRLDQEQDKQAAEMMKQMAEEFAKSGEINQQLAAALKTLQENNRKLEQQIAAMNTNGSFN